MQEKTNRNENWKKYMQKKINNKKIIIIKKGIITKKEHRQIKG